MDIRKRLLTENVVGHRNRLLRTVVMAPSLSKFRKHMDKALSHKI